MGTVIVEPGTVVADAYRANQRLGAGGMGEVWSAERLSDGSAVAIKVLLADIARTSEVIARFRREARVLARVRSDYIAEVIDFLTDPVFGFVIVMDLIPGDSLHLLLSVDQRLSLETTLDIAADVLHGLRDLHAVNIVHRDLKPGNIVLRPRPGLRPRATLIDFGVSRIISDPNEEEVTAITRGDRVLGTLEYMAPEQILGSRTVTGTADLYAVGALMFRAITGRHVFGDLTEGQLAVAKLNEDAPALPLGGRTDEVAIRTGALVARLLSRRVKTRLKSAEEAIDEVEAIRALVPCTDELVRASYFDDGNRTVEDPAIPSGVSIENVPIGLLASVRDGGVAIAPPAAGEEPSFEVSRGTVTTACNAPHTPESRPGARALTSGTMRSAVLNDTPQLKPHARAHTSGTMRSAVLSDAPGSEPRARGQTAASHSMPPDEGEELAAIAGQEVIVSHALRHHHNSSRQAALMAFFLFLVGAVGGGLFGFSYGRGGFAFELVTSARLAMAAAAGGRGLPSGAQSVAIDAQVDNASAASSRGDSGVAGVSVPAASSDASRLQNPVTAVAASSPAGATTHAPSSAPAGSAPKPSSRPPLSPKSKAVAAPISTPVAAPSRAGFP
jgi:serine/threonine-protein kinase